MEPRPNAQHRWTGSVCPTPNPIRIFQAHEVHPVEDIDCTRPSCVHGWTVEQQLREMRNHLIKDQLLRGLAVQYKAAGNSMHPHIHCGDTCVFEPVNQRTTLGVDDIVFCQVQPKNEFFAHWIISVQRAGVAAGTAHRYVIANGKGNVNGWCHREHIYGKLVEAVYVEESRLHQPRP